jgi:salicylate hydroxylase
MMSNSETAELMNTLESSCWIGDRKHIMAYPIRQGTQYNLVMSYPGQAALGKWNEPGDLNEMHETFTDFDPLIRRVLEYVTSTVKWLVADLPHLPRWASQNGKVVLVGDAAHAMLPFLAQVLHHISVLLSVLILYVGSCTSH